MIVRRFQKHFKQQQEYLGHVNGHVEEMYGGHVVMKAFNGEEDSLRRFDECNDKLYESAWKSQFLSGLMQPVMNFVGNLGYVAVCILGGWYASSGVMTVGDIQAFIQYMRQFTQPILQIANISNILQQTTAAAERVFEFLDAPEEEPDRPVVHVNEDDGAILIDGYDVRNFTRNELRSQFGMVLQETWLYNGTIRENIRYGRLDATDEEVEAAAKAAQADHFIRTLPGGYDMVLNEESSNVSQGQKQLLTIARAILSDPKILILDEATSSVDTRTEILIQKAMDQLMKGRTSFVIAHRLSTIRDAGCILCMKDGDIVEQGTHEELLERGGFYANLYNSQFERPSSLPA